MTKTEYFTSIRPNILKQVEFYIKANDVSRSKIALDEIKQLDDAFHKEDLREQGKYLTFADLFDDAVLYGLIKVQNEGEKSALFNIVYLYFDEWLKNNNGSIHSPEFLTKENFVYFHSDFEANNNLSITNFENKKQSWQPPRIAKENNKSDIKQFLNPLDFINKLKRQMLSDYEDNIADKVKLWQHHEDKTGCAVFCLILYEFRFFVPDKLITAPQFAIARYGIDCNIMIKKLSLKKNIKDLESKKEQMKRLLLNKRYGKISGTF